MENTRQTLGGPRNLTTLGGRYRILTTLGKGGMGTVVKAIDTRFNRIVVLKMVQGDSRALRHQVEVLAKISHPNIVQVYDVNEASGSTYLAMEYVEGRDLQAMLRQGKPLELDYAIDIVRHVGSALGALHGHGIVHGDIKPKNILVSNDRRVLLSGFGLAIPAGNSTERGGMKGTIGYMSPEQAKGLPADVRSDIFSLGLVLYELLTGCRPFSHETAEIQHRPTNEDASPPSQSNLAISASIDRVVLTSLARDPRERFQTVAEFVTALVQARDSGARRFLAGRTIPELLSAARAYEMAADYEACYLVVSIALEKAPDHPELKKLREMARQVLGKSLFEREIQHGTEGARPDVR